MDISHFWQELVVLAGLGSAALSIWKFVLSPVWKTIKYIKDVFSKVDTAIPVLFDIAHEFRPNGGNSLRDVLNRLEVAFLKTQYKTRLILDHLSIGVFETDANGNCLWVNTAWTEIASRTLEEAKGTGWLLSIHQDDRDAVFHEWKSSIEQMRDFNLTYRFVDNDGKVTKVKGSSTAIRDKEGAIIAYIGCVEKVHQ